MTLRECRKGKGLSQKALGEKIGVSQRAVSSYESKERCPSPELAKKIGETLKLTDAQIFQMFFKV